MRAYIWSDKDAPVRIPLKPVPEYLLPDSAGFDPNPDTVYDARPACGGASRAAGRVVAQLQ
eukprot:352371-Chlamydomonas_euryale.AAC.1